MLLILEFVLTEIDGINACRFDGSTREGRRNELLEQFNGPDSFYNVMLCSTSVEGVSLVGANKCIFYDPAWNQAVSDRAAARIYRIGQTRETECIHFISAGTVDEKKIRKQVFNGSMERLTLDPDGACESLEWSQQAQDGHWTKKCSTGK